MMKLLKNARQAGSGRWRSLVWILALIAMLAVGQLTVPRAHAGIGQNGGSPPGGKFTICQVGDFQSARASGSVIPIAFYLGNNTLPSASQCSVNLSNQGGTLTVVDVDGVFSQEGTVAPFFSPSLGNATPGYTFAYNPTQGGAPGAYTYNLNTQGLNLSSGQNYIDVAIQNDSVGLYTVTFNIK